MPSHHGSELQHGATLADPLTDAVKVHASEHLLPARRYIAVFV
jgi:hypothetical protein